MASNFALCTMSLVMLTASCLMRPMSTWLDCGGALVALVVGSTLKAVAFSVVLVAAAAAFALTAAAFESPPVVPLHGSMETEPEVDEMD